MAVKFFGQFLVEQGIISRDILLKAIALQESLNKSIGDVVQELGFMKAADVTRVNQAQRSVDLRFGDLAVNMGLLTEDQMKIALKKQSESHIYIGKAIVQVGGLKEDELQRYLDEFKADQAKYATDRVEIPANIPHAELWEMMADMSYKMFTRVARLTFRPGPSQLTSRIESEHITAAMDFTGDVRCRYVMSASPEVQTQIAKAMLSQDSVSHEPKEVLDDTIMEFINVVCGNIAAKSAHLGKTLDILPPEILDTTGGMEIPTGFKGIHFPIYLAEGHAAVTIIIYV